MTLHFIFGSIKHYKSGAGWDHVGPNSAKIWVKFKYMNFNLDKKGTPNSRKKIFKKL